jgi:hypothetical protein
MSALNPKRSSNSRAKSRPLSEVMREPWKWTFKDGLNETEKTDFVSRPLGGGRREADFTFKAA